MIKALYRKTNYTISMTTFLGAFMLMAWKKINGKDIPLTDSSLNPSPSSTDLKIIRLLEDASNADPVEIPETGIPDFL